MNFSPATNHLMAIMCLLCLGGQRGVSAPLPLVVTPDARPYHIRLVWDGGGTNQTVLIWPQVGPQRTIATPLNSCTVSNLFHTNGYVFQVTNTAGSSEQIHWPQPTTQTNIIAGIESAPTPYGRFVPFTVGCLPYSFVAGATNTFFRVVLAMTNDAWRYVGCEFPD